MKYKASNNINDLYEGLGEVQDQFSLLTVQFLSGSVDGSLVHTFAAIPFNAQKHVERIRKYINEGIRDNIDAIGWSTRCLFETLLQFQYLLKSEYSEVFVKIETEFSRSELELEIGLLHASGDFDSIEQLKKKMKGEFPKKLNVFEYAKDTGYESEYRNYYSLLCKYTHPNYWLLFEGSGNIKHLELANQMVERSLIYSIKILEGLDYIANYIGIDEKN